ncbi:hypothetical protein [Calycomorphotria hydatis]|uniref:Uncharacterized protein n=1 Tax=Calycomorphotria hydatis TaxID=2528027 RepID=A0A517T8D5_9PLAN|nr:hypothetical protein [Calycomorphotria hydatis]QDT64632.1 hypothetical protein V22_18720 [Calycomorphotria hydatis]
MQRFGLFLSLLLLSAVGTGCCCNAPFVDATTGRCYNAYCKPRCNAYADCVWPFEGLVDDFRCRGKCGYAQCQPMCPQPCQYGSCYDVAFHPYGGCKSMQSCCMNMNCKPLPKAKVFEIHIPKLRLPRLCLPKIKFVTKKKSCGCDSCDGYPAMESGTMSEWSYESSTTPMGEPSYDAPPLEADEPIEAPQPVEGLETELPPEAYGIPSKPQTSLGPGFDRWVPVH